MAEPGPSRARGMRDEEVLGKAYDSRLIRRLWRFVVPHWPLLLLGLVLIPLAIGFELAQPYLLKIVIDDYIAARELDGLELVALAYVLLVIFESGTSFGQLYSLQLLGQRSMHDLRQFIYRHVIRQRRGFFDDRPVGRLLTRMTNDVETINEIFSSGVVTLVADFIKMGAIVAMMLALDVRLTLITFLTLPILVVVVVYARRIMRNSFREIRVKLAAMNTFIQEHVSGMKVVQLFGRERRAADEYDELNGAHRDAYLGAIRADATMYAVVEAIGVVSAASIAWYAGGKIGETGLTVGLIVAFIEYINKFFIPVRDLSAKYTVMQSAMAASERIIALLDTDEPDAPAGVRDGDDRPADERGLAVDLEDVHFRYRDDEPVLRGVDLEVVAGNTVAVVGATGSGKSTIIRLLTRLYEPQDGAVRVFGRDVRSYPVDELRRRITVVSQDVFLFAGTVADNVRIGRPEASDQEIEAALDRVGALGLLVRRGKGIHQEVAERGGNFSAGERQLISFARALIRDPEILVLDEATAHVDPEVEGVIECALGELMRGRTTLVIAHRLSTIRRADRIVVLSRGSVAEHGTHDELIAAGGLYARLEKTFHSR